MTLDLTNLITNPMWLFYAIGFPLLLVLLLGFIASGSYSQTITSYDYYGVSLMIFAIFNASTFSANSFLEERIKKPNLRILFSPVRQATIPCSKIFSSFIFCSAAYTLVVLVLRLVVGVNYGGSNSWALLVIMELAILFFSALGVLVCCLLRSESIANNILSLLLTVFAFIGSVFFPVDQLGKVVSAISWVSPAKWLLTTSLQIIYDQDWSFFLPVCGGLLILSAVVIMASSRIFKGEDYL